MPLVRRVPTLTGEVAAHELGVTLVHEHIFVTSPDLDRDLPHPEWDEQVAIETAVDGLERLYELGVRTVVDLTVPGLGRDVARVARVAERTRVRIVAATGYYADEVLPPALRLHGPGLLVDGPDPLVELFLRDIERGIADTGVRAGMIKVLSDRAGITPDVERVFRAAATAHTATGVPITTHSHAASRGGLAQQELFRRLDVPLERVVIGHSGDSDDLGYLATLADAGSFLGFDRFGMAHVQSDDVRIRMLLALLDAGHLDRLLLSHDAAFFSRVTPPSWRAHHAPDWRMDHLHTTVLPRLRAAGLTADEEHRLLVDNPRRLLAGA